MMKLRLIQFSEYYKYSEVDNKHYITIKPNAPIEAILMAKKLNDCFIEHEGYAPVLNLDDFEIPETEKSESENIEQ